ncbi:MAG: hypothetical protein AABZ53_15270 [Planctomycetota bacterium]
MNEILRAVQRAGRRLFLIELIRSVLIALTLALAVMAVLRTVQQVFALSLQWNMVMQVAGGIVAAGSLSWSFATRARTPKAARVLDERAQLRESLSTALSIGEPKESWSKLVVETARAKAIGVDVNRAIPIEMPKRWYWPMAAAMVLAIAWTLPVFDALGNKAKKEEEKTRQDQVIAVKQDIKEKQAELDKVLAKIDPELKKELGDQTKPEELQPPGAVKPEAIRTAEMKRLTDLNEKLAGMAKGEKGMQLDAMKEMMAQLKHPGGSELNELYKNLAKGDFAKASKALDELKAKLGDKNLSPEEKKKIAEAMGKLGEQLKQNADAAKDIAKAMEQAGMDSKQAAEMAKQLAANPAMIAKALEALKGLSPEQKQQLAKQLTAKANASKNGAQMGQKMSECSGSMESGDSQGENASMSELGSQLSEAEMMQQQAQALSAAMSECQSQMAALGECMGGSCDGDGNKSGPMGLAWNQQEGDWKEGDSNKFGSNGKGGGPGKGQGDRSGSTPTDFNTEQAKLKVKAGKGPIIGKQYIKGEQMVGESVAEFTEAVEASKKNAAEALSNGEVPPELRATVRKYFGRLEEVAKANAKSQPKPEATPPAGK